MKRFIKWTFITVGILIIFSIIALLVIPNFIDIDKYKPIIEKKVSEAINRPFEIKGGLKLRLFPVAALSFSDLHIGNPKGFKEKDFASLKSFDVQVKLIPLILSKDLQVKRFVVKEPELTLIRNKEGKVNWVFDISKGTKNKTKDVNNKKSQGSAPAVSIPLSALSVNEFSISDGAIVWIDQLSGQKKGITGINLKLKDVSFTKPIGIELTAKVEGNPIVIRGKIGPLGKKTGQGVVPVSINMNAFNQLTLLINGKVKDITSKTPKYEFNLNVKPFSPRRLFSQFGGFPFKIPDPKAFQKLGLSAHISGSPESVNITNGILTLDQSKMKFSLKAKEFNRPCVAFNIVLNKINLDRYMPFAEVKKKKALASTKPSKTVKTKTARKVKSSPVIDYAPLRRLKMDGQIKITELIAKKAVFRNIYAKLVAKNGIIRVAPLKMDIYQGKMVFNADVNVRGKKPISMLTLNINDVHIGKMLKDMLRAEVLTGIFNLNLSLKTKGDTPETIISSLNGAGELLIKDGYIIGIDLKGMIHNVKAAFGFGEAQKLKRKTIFSEIRSKFRIRNGIFQTKETYLLSPHFKVSSKGDADLSRETLNFRISPEYVESSESTITVPVIVSGTFSSPSFAPDLTGIAKELIFKKLFKKKKEEKKEGKSLEDMGKELLRGIFGR